MEEYYDPFPVNILETGGTIAREPFDFTIQAVKIWSNQCCVIDQKINGAIRGKIVDQEMYIELKCVNFNQYISNNLVFSEISLNRDRVLWSNGLLYGGYSPAENIPSFLSLFYQWGNLSKVEFSNQIYAIEFYGNAVEI